MKKIIKIIVAILIVVLFVILCKTNIKATKEAPVESSEESTNVMRLDVNSTLVQNLYNGLNIDLVNSDCSGEEKCLNNYNYDFLYYKFDGTKTLSDQEKIYLAINYLYKNNLLTNTTPEDKTSYTISKDDMQNTITELFGVRDFSNFNSEFSPNQKCGITDYTFTGESYLIETNVCNNNDKVAKSKLMSAYKDDNYVTLNIKSFYYEKKSDDTTDDQKVIDIKNFNTDEVLDTVSQNHIDESADDLFDNKKTNEYLFRFELIGDNYYLKDITINKV